MRFHRHEKECGNSMKNQYLQLFHGSARIVENPLYGGGKPYNDYGPGFYCTENEDMAREWSVDAGRDGFVNRYELDTAGLDILHLSGGSFTILHWLAILLENRRFQTGCIGYTEPYTGSSQQTRYDGSIRRSKGACSRKPDRG